MSLLARRLAVSVPLGPPGPGPGGGVLVVDSRVGSTTVASWDSTRDALYGKFVAGAGVASAETVEVRVRIIQQGTAPSDLEWDIYDDNGGVPDTSIGSATLAQTAVDGAVDYSFPLTLTGPIVESSTYYLVGFTPVKGGASDNRYRWALRPETGAEYGVSTDGGATWSPQSNFACWFAVGTPADAPVGDWLFNETSGTLAADETGNHDGTYEGTVDLTAAALANNSTSALGLSGAGRAEVPHAAALNMDGHQDFAIRVWVKLTNGTTDALQVIADKTGLGSANNQWGMWYENRSSQGSPQQVRFLTPSNTLESPSSQAATMEAGASIVAVKRGHIRQELWINGVLVATGNTGAGGSNTRKIGVGALPGGSFELSGVLDKFGVLGHAPLPGEVEDLYTADTV